MADNPKTLYQIACEAHEEAFGCGPLHWGFHAINDDCAKRILASIVLGSPYDETPDGYDPKSDDSIIG